MNSNGFISARFDFNAFGEKISLGIGLRSIDQGYSAPQNSRQGYGVTETDSATGLDHTWFRKNENRAGRWTSPDPYKGSMSLGSSGSFNRYSYVENQPTNFLDPSGLLMIIFWNCVPGGVEQPGFCYIDYIWYIPEGTGGGGGTRGGGGGGGGEGIPADAWKYATNAAPQPAPRNSNFSALRNGATVVAGAGAAYAGYRIIRLLPSLAPPLWPTIPVNLAVP